jgi:hypothetical protein
MDIEIFSKLEPLISNGMSIFQMDKFVINDSITPFRKLRQAFIEGKSRVETLANSALDIEELEIKKQIAQAELDQLASDLQKKLKLVEIKRYELSLNRTRLHRTQIIKEAEFFLGIATDIINDHFGGIESAIKQLSDPEFYNQQEEDFWTEKMARSVFADLINFGTITKGLSESISCLSIEQQKLIFAEAMHQQDTLNILLENTKDNLLVQRD